MLNKQFVLGWHKNDIFQQFNKHVVLGWHGYNLFCTICKNITQNYQYIFIFYTHKL